MEEVLGVNGKKCIWLVFFCTVTRWHPLACWEPIHDHALVQAVEARGV